MKTAIIYPEILPSDKARTVTVVKTAAALGKISDVTLICEKSQNGIDEICSHYGVQKSFSLVKISKKLLFKSNKIFNFFLIRHLRIAKYDAIYVRHLKTAEALIKNGFDIVFEAHEVFADSAPDGKKNATAKSEKYVYEHAKGVVFISKSLEDEFLKRFVICKSVVLPLALVERVQESVDKSFEGVQEIYYIGSFQSWKGVDTLIKSAKYLNNGVKIKLIGSGADEQKLRELAAQIGVDDRVEFVGRVAHSQVAKLLSQESKICVLPNNNSAFDRFTSPLKLFEYMATFNAVVASDIESIKDVTDGAVVYFAAGDEVGLADRLNYLVANPSAAKEFAQKAYDKIAEFEPKTRAVRLLDFLKESKC